MAKVLPVVGQYAAEGGPAAGTVVRVQMVDFVVQQLQQRRVPHARAVPQPVAHLEREQLAARV